ncbi:MAG: hypothetical protein QGF53_03200, partial [Alphaproteobacteria bacterium]|nr:hypothetical protein [Alphaproteobacteria bacterium]
MRSLVAALGLCLGALVLALWPASAEAMTEGAHHAMPMANDAGAAGCDMDTTSGDCVMSCCIALPFALPETRALVAADAVASPELRPLTAL